MMPKLSSNQNLTVFLLHNKLDLKPTNWKLLMRITKVDCCSLLTQACKLAVLINYLIYFVPRCECKY
jgi:hypothetical protein